MRIVSSAALEVKNNLASLTATAASPAAPVPSINGIALFETGQNPPYEAVQELAYAELLRQEAVRVRLLPRNKGLTAPELTALVGYYTMVAMTLNAHEIPLPEGAQAAFPWPQQEMA